MGNFEANIDKWGVNEANIYTFLVGPLQLSTTRKLIRLITQLQT